MSKTLLLFSFWLPLFSFAENACWQNEIHPLHLRPYATQQEWEQSLSQWQTQKPPAPLITSLLKAHKTYQNELSNAQKMGNDKRKHCYMGCRIAQETSVDVAIY